MYIRYTFFIINGAPRPILSKIRLMDKIPRVYSDPYTQSQREFAQCILLWNAKHFRNCLPAKTRNCFDKSFVN